MKSMSLRVLAVLLLAAGSAQIVGAQSPGDPYVDKVAAFTPGNPASERFGNPEAALGAPDFNEAEMRGWVALGVGGSITLEFVDNLAINGPGPDLKIHADPAGDERIVIELSADGLDYVSLGLLSEGEAIDLAEVGFTEVRFVRLTDSGAQSGGVSPGAEIDAVEALNSRTAEATAGEPAAAAPSGRLTWVRTGGPLGGLGYDVRIRPDDPQRMYVTDAFAGVHVSEDGGVTWKPSNEGIRTRVGESGDAIPVFSLTIDPNDHDIIWAGTQYQRGIFKSVDAGMTWTKSDSGVTEAEGITFRGFGVEPGNSNVVYAAGEVSSWAWAGRERQGREFDMTQGVVYKTVDGGASWKPIWRGDNLARYIWIDPRDVQTLYVSTGIFDREAANSDPASGRPGGEGVVKSTDGGRTWSNINEGLENLYVGSLFMHPENPDLLLAGTGNNQYFEGGGIYLSTNAGASWTRTQPDDIITSVEFAAADPQVAYAGSAGAIYRSSDGGRSWTRVSGGSEGSGWGAPGVRAGFPIDFQVDLSDPDRLFANEYGGGNFLSADGGRTWEDASPGYTGAQVRALAVDSEQPGHVIAAARSGVFSTRDGGGEWAGISHPPFRVLEWNAVAIDPRDPQHILAANNWNSAILDSADGGASWEQTGARFGEVRMGWRVIAFAPSDSRIVYAGSAGYYSAGNFGIGEQPGEGVYFSRDGGRTWQPSTATDFADAHIAGLAVDHRDPQRVFAAAAKDGILLSTDGGMTWESAGGGLPGSSALAVAVGAENSDVALAGFYRGGIYRSEDGGRSWLNSSAGMAPESSVASIVLDPTNESVIYAGTMNSGVYRSLDGGVTWEAIVDGLRMRAVNALALSSDGMHLYAATEGEGVFRLDLNGEAPAAAPGAVPETTGAAAPTQASGGTSAQPTAEPAATGTRGIPCLGGLIVPVLLLAMTATHTGRIRARMDRHPKP